jgi:hypothetical protein
MAIPVALPFDLGTTVAAIGALGTASFALVDATKIARDGGISNSGFSCIESAVQQLFPGAVRKPKSSLPSGGPNTTGDEQKLLDILHGHWINGSALGDQKAIAKSLIKLRLTPQTAQNFAAATSVDGKVLSQVASKMTQGEELNPQEINALGRFDLALTAILDEGYQRADQKYRNSARVLASAVAVVLAVLGGLSISENPAMYFWSVEMSRAVLCGLLATPLAPIAKDLANAVAAGVKVAQAVKR